LSTLGPGPSTEYSSFLPLRNKTVSLSMETSPFHPWHGSAAEEGDYQKQAQIGWDSEADFINEECELPYPG
uniref:AGC-kinase C-terminal domain-containing protein n=1 Tax=Gongylonema pulchrum TaxID=637853 RepID=A0A183EHQ6_9BILA